MFVAARDGDKETADTVEHKQHFVVVNPDTLQGDEEEEEWGGGGGLSGPAYEKLRVKIVQLDVIKKQNI